MKNVTLRSVLIFLFLQLALWGGCGYWLYNVISNHQLPMWILKLSFVIMCFTPISSMMCGIFRLYWSGELEESENKSEPETKMKIYGSSNS